MFFRFKNRSRQHNRPFLLLIVALAISGSIAASDTSTSADTCLSGAYSLQICRGPCASKTKAKVLARGLVVLMPAPFDEKVHDVPGATRFGYGYSFIGETNGCFVLKRTENAETYAGLIPAGWTRWSGSPDGFIFDLYASPDAWYTVHAELIRDGFTGKGTSTGGSEDGPGWPKDHISATRIGRATLDQCFRAAAEIGK